MAPSRSEPEENIKKKSEETFPTMYEISKCWIELPKLVTSVKNPSLSTIKNCLTLIDKLPTPKTEEKQLEALLKLKEDETYGPLMKGKKKKYLIAELEALRKAVCDVWYTIKNWPHSQDTLKTLMVVFNERIIHNLENPLALADFLMDLLDHGGAIAVLALQAIFTLIVQHNFDCAKIFKKLYALFEPNIFHTKYKARLMYLSNICFSSTHLQESLVAAFVKRLAQLSLRAPASDVIIIAAFIGNLIIRHPTLKSLIHGPPDTVVGWDPYLPDEPEPESSNALKSSLWELKSLQSHILPNVAGSVKYIDQNPPSMEWDLDEKLENDYNSMFDKELHRKGDVSTTYERPAGLSLAKGEQVLNFWSIA